MISDIIRSFAGHSGPDESPHHAGGTAVWHATAGGIGAPFMTLAPMFDGLHPLAVIAVATLFPALIYAPKEVRDYIKGAELGDCIEDTAAVAFGAAVTSSAVVFWGAPILATVWTISLFPLLGLGAMFGTTIKRNREKKGG